MPRPNGPHAAPEPLIVLRGITKSFPNVVANDQVDLDIYSGEVHALLGENGAGKSTLMKILYGFYRADAGQVLYRGEPVVIHSPHEARNLRIGMVFQDLNLIPAFTVAENIALFLPHLQAVLNPPEIDRRITEISERHNLQVDAHALVAQLAIGEQQRVEILKLLLSDARALILDEPTRVLAPHEVNALFTVLDNLRRDGYAIVLITHKLKEVLACADRITVLRGGRVAGTMLRAQASEEKLVTLMFEKALATLQISPPCSSGTTQDENGGLRPGREARQDSLPSSRPLRLCGESEPHSQLCSREGTDTPARPLLELQGVGTRGEGSGTRLKGIDLQIYPGEIVGVAGVSGNGQRELCDVVLGMEPCSEGRKYLYGRDLTNRSIGAMRRNGVAFIPENPLSMASVPFMTVLENMALTNTWRYARRGGLAVDWLAVKADAEETATRLGFPVAWHAPARSLSGGNLQRMVIVREMAHAPRVIVASYLTRGLDVQSAIAARQALVQARGNGAGVLLVSEDLDELLTLSDRLIVLYGGRIVGRFKPAEMDIYQVGHLMTGSEAQRGAKS